MRFLSPVLFVATVCGPCLALSGQTPASTSAAPAAVQSAATPSAMLKPGLDSLQQTIGTLRLEKWKTSNAVRDETDANLTSMRRDLEATLPPLLAAADGAPGSVARMVPVFRNIGALYDVLLRVVEAARLSAPSQQSTALMQAMSSLDDGRRALGERMQSVAVGQEKQIGDLQAAVRAIPPAVVCAPAATTPAHPATKRKPKPAAKPAAPANTQGSAPAPPAK